VIFEWIEWDDENLEHATRRATVAEIEQAIFNASAASPSRYHEDRVMFRSATDRGHWLWWPRLCETECGRQPRGMSDDE
jgi:hypothetical protein